ncbi:thioredoxin family protein [Aquimarina sp. AD10]|uniref:Thioredoxin n=1 Tax=Aquimarina aggregata TaxID=1642818 RepID=A0A162ZMH0_9FLAO|nr:MULTISPECIES: thioredoxin family protein [Aquimarina]AXT62226.1 thioredoxin family protein [Aquimarina sp. AD10]KZS39909.1 thioredoxin [Aquimarina aggregata]RKM90579.1 thioredoxin family protein [Aquimarina sp. AD10]
MSQTINKTVTTLIEQGIADSYTYPEYRKLVSDLLVEDKSTGHEQSEALTNYSMLNDRRMKRLDKTLKIDEAIQESFANAETKVTWLVLTEGWCGDAAQSLPVINKLAELNEGIDLRIISRDDNDELMNNFLTNGGKSIPKLIAYDTQNKKVINSWGPRPSVATQLVNDYKAKHGGLDAEFKESLQVWYNKDKGANIAEDLSSLI